MLEHYHNSAVPRCRYNQVAVSNLHCMREVVGVVENLRHMREVAEVVLNLHHMMPEARLVYLHNCLQARVLA